LAMSPSLRSQ